MLPVRLDAAGDEAAAVALGSAVSMSRMPEHRKAHLPTGLNRARPNEHPNRRRIASHQRLNSLLYHLIGYYN